jgi:hypothetical protein
MKSSQYLLLISVFSLALCMQCNLTRAPANPNAGKNLCGELAGSSYAPLTLGELLCVARDSAGVFYVVDKVQSDMRFFVSRNDSLFRKEVLGSSIIGEQYYFLSIQDNQEVIFQNSNKIWSDVYICQGNCAKCDSLLSSHISPTSKSVQDIAEGWIDVCAYLQNESPNCCSLAVAEAGDIGNYHLLNFPPTTHIEYLARRPESQYLLVTRSAYDWNGDVVVHYGMSDQMEKREVVGFLRASDGGSTWIRFMVGSTQYEAFFGVEWDSVGVHAGKTFLRIASDTLALERINPTKEILNGLGFDCAHEMQF